ncbi:sensor histidine kinase [Marinigracilibium pacificum]|uniref:histidine kinase n=1 Tax=Marinigracilibium pacificum TaxID=2729599 RepID=A0A848J1B5_9BACT|nr:ATP-binding protein [Marinigracilibium pacificum]NMM49461.1 GHKL domain-containing protein [Marinigracilibium pacificum]
MVSSTFRFNIIFRISILLISVFLFAHQIYSNGNVLGSILILLLIVFQVISFIKYIEKSNEEILGIIDSLSEEDFSVESQKKTTEAPDASSKILQKLQEVNAEKEAHYQYLKNIVQHLGIGIITFDKSGKIQIMNTAAKRLLKVRQVKSMEDLRPISELLVNSCYQLRTGGRDLIKIEQQDDIVQLAIYAIELTLKNEEFKLVSIQNIQSELEEKEMEAWQNLIRVLTHEIMNSVTPISSLAATVEGELQGQLVNGHDMNTISNEDIETIHMAVQTIQRRSEGLIRFVSDFRNLARVPDPKFEDVELNSIFIRLKTLFKNDLEKGNIECICTIIPEDLTLKADPELLEQVFINLVKNAIQAFDELDDNRKRKIEIHATQGPKNQVIVKIEDNGPGIDEEALEKLFIPFFTTKKHGSGIGLSISKQILRKHKAAISVKSEDNVGTEFTIRF